MQFAVELLHSSTAFTSWVCARLEVCSHEDIDTLSQPWIVPFVHTACEQARARYKPDSPGEARLMIGNAIRLMCRARKSRAGCHFAAAIGLASLLEDHTPTVPDFALDQHTQAGRAKGRGLDHFRQEGAKLIPPAEPDEYEAEAYRLWALKAASRRR